MEGWLSLQTEKGLRAHRWLHSAGQARRGSRFGWNEHLHDVYICAEGNLEPRQPRGRAGTAGHGGYGFYSLHCPTDRRTALRALNFQPYNRLTRGVLKRGRLYLYRDGVGEPEVLQCGALPPLSMLTQSQCWHPRHRHPSAYRGTSCRVGGMRDALDVVLLLETSQTISSMAALGGASDNTLAAQVDASTTKTDKQHAGVPRASSAARAERLWWVHHITSTQHLGHAYHVRSSDFLTT